MDIVPLTGLYQRLIPISGETVDDPPVCQADAQDGLLFQCDDICTIVNPIGNGAAKNRHVHSLPIIQHIDNLGGDVFRLSAQ